VVRIVLQTANRTFDGYDPQYHGQGILDMKAAVAELVREYP
jgi:hypothetical protein